MCGQKLGRLLEQELRDSSSQVAMDIIERVVNEKAPQIPIPHTSLLAMCHMPFSPWSDKLLAADPERLSARASCLLLTGRHPRL